MSGTGCSAYSSPTPASRVSASTADGTSQPPFASTRIAASGSASRTAATRAASSSRLCPGSATLILTASTRPKRARISWTRSAVTAGTVALTGMLVRSGSGNPCQPASIAAKTSFGWKWMSAITGIWDFLAMIGSASASSADGQATRTMLQPEAVSSAICCKVALMSVFGVVVMDWTLMGESEPTPTDPTLIWRVLRRGARTGGGADGIPRLTEVTWTPF
ncbi:hypothetical protein SRABI128_06583 [Microbacterium sp. Bi128]|nr:hypothetical protein SRABI128_06583 [Microbacterium sp. Bi128]